MAATSRIKILHVVNSLKVGGLEQVLVNLVNGLDPSRYQHVVCCIDSTGPMQERFAYPVTVYDLKKGNKADYLLPFKIATIIRKETPHIVHTRNWSAVDGVVAAILAGTATIIHDEHGRDAADPLGRNYKRKLIRRLLSPWISRFIAVSKDLEEWLVSEVRIPAHKVLKIHNGVDTAAFSLEKKGTLKARFAPGTAFVVGFVGRLNPVKDVPTLLKAFAHFVKHNSAVDGRLVIVGDGPDRELLHESARSLGVSSRVIFAGERADISDIMKAFDVFVLSSITEGIPMTVLEAMSSGLPVISTDVGGVHELVTPGHNGFLVAAGDVEGLSDCLGCYATSKAELAEHGSNSRSRAVTHFSLSSMVRRYDEIYNAGGGA